MNTSDAGAMPMVRRSLAFRKLNVLEPSLFNPERFIVDDDGFSHAASEIAHCKVVGVVSVLDDGSTSEVAAAEPDANVWFHVDCRGHAGAAFDLATDGDGWYSLNRRSKRVSSNRYPKHSVDLCNMGQTDRELIREAIRVFLIPIQGA